MGTITTGIGLVSGIDTASLIEQLLSIEARGKLPIQRRVASLQSQQTALLDINSRLLNMQNAASGLRKDKIFQSALATSSNESSLTASASAGALPGTYKFIVDRLVGSSQQMSKGFSSLTQELGLRRMTFELGGGRVNPETDLADLNGGEGIRRGKIRITDADGGSAVVDLSRATELSEVLDAINSAEGVSVSVAISGDALELTDSSGGAGSMTIENISGYFTATDLGIAGNDAGSGTLTGTDINYLGDGTALAKLNDGNGVLVNGGIGNPDFRITDRTGASHDIILGKYDNGSTTEDSVTTLEGVIARINTISAGAVTAAIASDGVSLELTDTTAGGGNFIVAGVGSHGDQTARDLGILNAGVASNTISGDRVLGGMNSVLLRSLNGGNGILGASSGGGTATLTGDTLLADLFQGDGLTTNGNTSSPDVRIQDRAGTVYEVELDNLTTVQDLIDAFDTASGGNITLSIIAGNALRATNTSTGLFNFQIQDLNGAGAIAELGLTIDSPPVTGPESIDGVDTDPAGPGGTTLDITNRNGVLTSIDLSTAQNLSDVIGIINAAGAGVTASLNDARNGVFVTDTSGGSSNLIIAGNAADDLGLNTGASGIASKTFRGLNLQAQYVSGASSLSSLNYGRGIGTGQFRITDADGEQATVDIGTDSTTVQEVIDEINSKGLSILARINDTGDGIIIENTSGTGTLALRVDSLSGSTARDLGILGSAADPLIDNSINGSYERTVTFDETDTLNDVLGAINDANVPVSASVINTGTGSAPYRLTFTSEVTGRAGELSVDSERFDIGLSTVATGTDSRVFFGSADAATGLLIQSPTNQLDKVISKVKIDLKATSDTPVTVSIVRDTGTIKSEVKKLVTTFNDIIGRINQYDKFDAETETKGVLLGEPTVARVRQAMYRAVNSKAIGVDSQFQFLSQVGIRVGTDGLLEMDDAAFDEAYESDPKAVEDLFVAYDKETETETLPGGVETGVTIETFNAKGLAEIFAGVLEGMTNSVDGMLTLADQNFDRLIESNTDRLEAFDARLEAKRERLQRQFAAMEAALARLQGQSNAIGGLSNNVLLSSISAARTAARR